MFSTLKVTAFSPLLAEVLQNAGEHCQNVKHTICTCNHGDDSPHSSSLKKSVFHFVPGNDTRTKIITCRYQYGIVINRYVNYLINLGNSTLMYQASEDSCEPIYSNNPNSSLQPTKYREGRRRDIGGKETRTRESDR